MNEQDAHAKLAEYIDKFKTKTAAAAALGVTLQFLTDITKSRRYRNVPDRILKGMGFRRETRIMRIKKRRRTVGTNGATAE